MAVRIATNLWVAPAHVVCVKALAHGVEVQFTNGGYSVVEARAGQGLQATAAAIAEEIWGS